MKSIHAVRDLLGLGQLSHILDVGASAIDGPPIYRDMLAAGLCRITGLEPNPQEHKKLVATASPLETYLPYAAGDGTEKNLHLCRYPGWTSTLMPSRRSLQVFDVFARNATVVATERIQTKRLDDIDEIPSFDMLKIDIQGAELEVLRNANNKLSSAVFVHTEVSFVTLYEAQPSFGDVDVELRRQGFVPHCFVGVKKCPISPLAAENDPNFSLNQLLEADVAYVKDFRFPERLADSQLKQIAFLSHGLYGSFDLAARCTLLLEKRKAIDEGSLGKYLATLNSPAPLPSK